jgi:cytochrome b
LADLVGGGARCGARRLVLLLAWHPLQLRHRAHLATVAPSGAAAAGEEEEGGAELVHVWVGYIVGVIVVLRVLWGFVGPERARFRDFVYGPVTTIRYLADLLRGRARRYLGHSPAGGAMVVLLLLSLAATVVTGLITYGDRGKGPLADSGTPFVAAAYADEDKSGPRRDFEMRRNGEDAESVFGEVHITLANITLALVLLHILGVGVVRA